MRASVPALYTALWASGLLVLLSGCATPPPPPTSNTVLPVSLQVNPLDVLQDVVKTSQGDRSYICRRVQPVVSAGTAPAAPRATPLQWVVVGTAARLVDRQGRDIGTLAPARHFFANDGSYLIANLAVEVPVSQGDLFWARYGVRYVATPRPGTGRFAAVSALQRIDTHGGLPPTPQCDLEGAHLAVPFSATYKLYREGTMSPAVP